MQLGSSVTRAALVVGVEGAALLVLGAGYTLAGAVGRPYDRTATVLQGVLAALAGALVLLVARALLRRAGWSRSPAVVLQLLALPVGYGLAQGGVWFAAVPVLVLAAVVLYLLATPEARLVFRTTA